MVLVDRLLVCTFKAFTPVPVPRLPPAALRVTVVPVIKPEALSCMLPVPVVVRLTAVVLPVPTALWMFIPALPVVANVICVAEIAPLVVMLPLEVRVRAPPSVLAPRFTPLALVLLITALP